MEIDWTVALPHSGDVPVWVCVATLEHEWKRSENEYIVAGGHNGMPGKYKNFGQWILSAKHVEMPEVCLVAGFVRFNNGRHRFAWLRDHGVIALPVAVQPSDVAAFRRKFGSPARTSQWLSS
ncbi:hypothetical protein [Massilia sp. CT11-137]|uniref:hypothetical protein n=1 Tax=Massilia sp. CT11-137 TaxID=3393901 RepID=UPI0039AEA993